MAKYSGRFRWWRSTMLASGLIASTLFCCAANGQSNPKALDLIDVETEISITVNDLNGFAVKASNVTSKLIGVTSEDVRQVFLGPMERYSLNVDLDKALMFDGPASLFFYNRPLGNRDKTESLFGATLLLKDSDGSFERLTKLKRSGTEENKLLVEDKRVSGRLMMVRGNQFWAMSRTFSFFKKEKTSQLANQSPRDFLEQSVHQEFDDADAVVFLNAANSRVFWGQILNPIFDEGKPSDAENDVWQRIVKAGDEVKFGIASLKLEDGIQIRSRTVFDPNRKADEAERLIKEIRGGDQPTSLRNMPDGKVILAASAKGNGRQNVAIARAMLRLGVDSVFPRTGILKGQTRNEFYERLTKVWQLLDGTKIGIYRNDFAKADRWGLAEKVGEVAAVAVLQTEKPEEILSEVPSLVRFVNEGIGKNPMLTEKMKFRYRKNHQKLGGYDVDLLRLETDVVKEDVLTRLKKLLGPRPGDFRIVKMKKHLIVLVGGELELLNQAIANVEQDLPGLEKNERILASRNAIDPRRKVEIYMSASNFREILFSGFWTRNRKLRAYKQDAELTAAALVMEQDRFGFDFKMPQSQIGEFLGILGF